MENQSNSRESEAALTSPSAAATAGRKHPAEQAQASAPEATKGEVRSHEAVEVPLERLVEADWNPNRMPPKLQVKLKRSITKFGVVENLVVRPHPAMTALADAALDQLVEAILPKLVARGFVLNAVGMPPHTTYDPDYDAATCMHFLNRAHLGDSVLERALLFFRELEQHGEISSPDLVQVLGIKGPTSLPANLTNPLKKRARKLAIPLPWTETSSPEGTRTVWRDRDGIAARMVIAIKAERERRKLA